MSLLVNRGSTSSLGNFQVLRVDNNAADDDDVMYNSLRRLSSSTAMSTNPQCLRRVSPTPIPYRDVQKELTFTLSEIYYTDGKTPIDDNSIEQKSGTKRHLYRKRIKSIGTSLKNCVLSDTVTIDIEPESTKLPLMCKLMIIVEGAVFERGTRVLVRDASIQVGEGDLNVDVSNTLKPLQIPFITIDDHSDANIKVDFASQLDQNELQHQHQQHQYHQQQQQQHRQHNNEQLHQVQHQHNQHQHNHRHHHNHHQQHQHQHQQNPNHASLISSYERRRVVKQHNNINNLPSGRYRSSESINYEAINNQVKSNSNSPIKRSNLVSNRTMSGGSLSNLNSSLPLTIYSEEGSSSNYFNKKKRSTQMVDSFLDLNEYTSTPYYQYQRKNLGKKDFSSDALEFYEYYSSFRSLLNNNHNASHETVEVHIPIKIEPEVHRNEKRILINAASGESLLDEFNGVDKFRSFTDNMRRYLDERMNRFEAEVTLFNLNENTTTATRFNQPVMSFKQQSSNHPVSYAYHYQHAAAAGNNNSGYIKSIKDNLQITSSSSLISNSNNNNNNNSKPEPSVTNLMLMQIVDGRLIE